MASDFANFFINNIKIRDVLDHHLTYNSTEAKVPEFAEFREMSENEVLTIIRKSLLNPTFVLITHFFLITRMHIKLTTPAKLHKL